MLTDLLFPAPAPRPLPRDEKEEEKKPRGRARQEKREKGKGLRESCVARRLRLPPLRQGWEGGRGQTRGGGKKRREDNAGVEGVSISYLHIPADVVEMEKGKRRLQSR